MAFSYYAQRSELGTNTGREIGREEAARKPGVLESLLQRIGLIVLGTVILAVVVSNLVLSSSPRVMPVSADSTPYFLHSMDDYRAAIAGTLQESIWNTNKLTIDTAAVAKKIKQQFPELASASVTLPLLGHRPVVYIEANRPALILSTTHGSYVVDSAGTVMLPTTQLKPDSKLSLPVVTDQTGVPIGTGRLALTSDNVAFIQQVAAQLKAHGMSASALTLSAAAGELDMTLAGQSYYVKFNMHSGVSDVRSQVGTFLAVQHKLASSGITPDRYIDVRVDGRAYYR